MAVMIPDPHYIGEEQDFIDLVDELKKGITLDKVSTNAGLNRHTVKSAFSKGSAGKFSTVLAICKSMGYDIIIARNRGNDEESTM